MGSSESGGVKNGGAGSIVWVRRRNGSWWPGKILGPDELSSSHLLSPRSGTPVKLLGREDASVDWYNLEKSKRVKAFRCGEFDDCIERAEASFGLPAKKREKYARREDAILHALELEKQFIERKFGKPGRANSVREHLPDPERKDFVRSYGGLENGNGKLGNHELHQVERTVDISDLIEKKKVPQHISKGKDGTNQGLKELGADLSCQMRDFPSLELKQVPVNRMFPPLAASEDSNRLLVDGHVYCVSTAGPCFDNSSDSDSKISFGKRKRPLEGFTEETFPKRRESLRSIVKVRQNYAELHDNLSPDVHRRGLPVDGVHHSMYLPSELHETFVTKQGNQMEMPISRLQMVPCRSQLGGFAADTSSGSSEETESDSSETHSLEANVEAGAMLSDAETFIRAHPRMRERLQVQVRHGSASSEESDELPLDNRFYFHDQSPATSVSKWQLKGKRNVRSIQKRPIDRFTQGTHPETMGRSMGPGASSHCSSYYHDNGYTNDTGFVEDDFDHHSQGFSKRGYLPSLAQARQNFIGHNMMELEELPWGRPLRGFWEERGVYFNTLYGSTRNGHDLLIDVDLKVQANRQGGEHVPWVSMMSRLNGKAIIGHPIQIETLEDGSTDFQVLTNDMCGTVRYDFDRSKVSPVWSTTKRTTNLRVPHSQAPSSQFHLDGDEDDDNEYIHQSGRVRSKKHLISNSVHKGLPMKKTHSPHFVSKMPSRKADLSLSQKTKALSSIGSDYKFPIKRKGEESSSHIGDVIKPLDSVPQTTVACIPVKLVFTRLREAVCRPPSAPAKHGVQ